MTLDLDYTQSLLQVFINAPTTHITFEDIGNSNIVVTDSTGLIDEKFYFHFLRLVEQGLITDKDSNSNLSTMGINSSDPGITVVPLDIRLSQRGDDFAKALAEKEVLIKLKNELKNAPFEVIFEGSQKILQHICKKKIDSLIAS